jgi:hypothetical protein
MLSLVGADNIFNATPFQAINGSKKSNEPASPTLEVLPKMG